MIACLNPFFHPPKAPPKAQKHNKSQPSFNKINILIRSDLVTYGSGLRRIDGLNRSWRSIIQDVKTQCQKKEYTQRGYERPLDIVNNLSGEYRVLAELQLFNGLRIGEMYKFSMANLVGNSLHLTNTKGGKARLTIELPPDTKRDLIKLIDNGRDGVYKPDLRSYQHELRKAVRISTQRFTGSHGLRYNYAQHRMYLLQENGLSYSDARLVVSKELGHNRPGIVEVYLRR